MDESGPSSQALQDPSDESESLLIAVDGSAGAERVASMGARVSRALRDATIHVVHVFRTSALDRPRIGTPAGTADLIEDAKERLAYHVRSVRRQSRRPVVGHFCMGDPSTEILRVAAECRVALLVVGTHDYVGLDRYLLGSIAETLMRKAPCPVLVVRPKSHAKG